MIKVSIDGGDWTVDGRPTHPGRTFRGWRVEGLLLNARMANGVFDDENPLTRDLWRYPDSGTWDAERNTDELIAMLPHYRAHGLDAIGVNLQGASPLGYYRADDASLTALLARIRQRHPEARPEAVWAGVPDSGSQPWDSGGFAADGSLKPAHRARAERLIRAAGEAGLVVILGLFYFGQDERLRDEQAVRRAVVDSCEWVHGAGLHNVVVEINNECDVPRYEHAVLTPARVHELIDLAHSVSAGSRRLAVGTSYARYALPSEAVVAASDLILLHGNGIDDPQALAARIDAVRATPTYRGQPVVVNEDDHFDFDRPDNHFLAALSRHTGWGFFDPGPGAGGSHAFGDYRVGYQNPPISWAIDTPRKRGFFELLREVTGTSG